MEIDEKRLTDDYGREIRSLRFSLTSRCTLNCIYCHHEGDRVRVRVRAIAGREDKGKDSDENKDEISAELVIAIARAASDHFGIRKIKITGGEPLMRTDLAEILQGMRAFEYDISLTTNGIFLKDYAADLAEAGLDRVNISLDSLKEERYDFITRTKKNLPRVIDGIYSAIDAGLTPIKLNMVILKTINDDEIADMIRFVRECNRRCGGRDAVILQLIELMPLFNSASTMHLLQHKYKYKPDFDKIEAELELQAAVIETRRLHRRKKYFVDGIEVEVVHPIDNTVFCANCSRLRITSEGKLKGCLLRDDNLIQVESTEEGHIVNQLKEAMKYRESFFTFSTK
ncbi:MAG: GTP 3',8-cyclase MoaA [Methanophagales archaeon]|nr:GTP 3',8-cyclase MoaA [Methanophagales archaeon]